MTTILKKYAEAINLAEENYMMAMMIARKERDEMIARANEVFDHLYDEIVAAYNKDIEEADKILKEKE